MALVLYGQAVPCCLCWAIHLGEQELHLFPMLALDPSIQPWENEL